MTCNQPRSQRSGTRPPLLEPDQDRVLRAIRKRLTPPAIVAAVAKEEEVRHAIVTKVKELVEAGSATMV